MAFFSKFGYLSKSNVAQVTKCKEYAFLAVLIAAFFPWSPPILMFSDLQPLAFVLGCLYAAFFVRVLSKWTIIPLFTGLAAILVAIIMGGGALALRGVFPYISFFVLYSISYDFFKSGGKISVSVFYIALSIWALVGILQFSNPEFGHELISRRLATSLSGGRGVAALSPEPTFYAFQMIFVALFLYCIYCMNRLKLRDLCVTVLFASTQLLFMSKSTTLVIILLIVFTFYLLMKDLRLVVVPFVVFYLIKFFAVGRLGEVFHTSIKNSLISDQSISDRLSHMLYSYYNFIFDYMLPHGFNAWQLIDSAKFKNILFYNTITQIPRILSLSGSVLFELGFLGIPFYLFITAVPYFSLKAYGWKTSLAICFLLFMLSLNAIPLALPFFAILYGALAVLYDDRSTINNQHLKC